MRQYESQAEDLRTQIADGEAQISGGRGLVQGIGGITSSFENASISDPTQFPPEVSGIIENAEQLSSMLPDGSLPEGGEYIRYPDPIYYFGGGQRGELPSRHSLRG